MFRCIRRSVLISVVLVALLGGLLSNPAAAADRVRFALPGNSMGYLPLIVAIQRGFFKDENIDLESIRLVATVAHNALLLNEVQYHGRADSALRLAARGAPVKDSAGKKLPSCQECDGASKL